MFCLALQAEGKARKTLAKQFADLAARADAAKKAADDERVGLLDGMKRLEGVVMAMNATLALARADTQKMTSALGALNKQTQTQPQGSKVGPLCLPW